VSEGGVRFLFLLPIVLSSALGAPPVEFLLAARAQIGVTVLYDAAYTDLDYPGGDVSMDRGVCTDVVVRAMRKTGWIFKKQCTRT
jgi:uncharacterized protein YijF (DUF1287 family)